MTQQLGGPDNGAAVLIPSHVDFTGLFDITIQIFNFVNGQASSKYAFIDNDTGANWADPRDIGLTWENVASVSGTTLSSSSYMAGPIRIRTYFQPNGNPFAGQLLGLSTNNQIAATAQNIVQNSGNTNNSSIRNFDELLWGDSPASVSRGSIQVVDTSGTRTTTITSGQWGVGVTNGTQTFSKLLLDRFLEGQLTSIRVANFRLVIPTDAKDKDDGTAVRPQYINPVGLLVENRPQEPPMSYVMQRGTFHVLMDEWDFQGFEIQSESTSASSVIVTDSRGGAIDIPVNTAPPSFLQRPTSSSINSAASNNIITTLTTAVSGLGSDLVANGNYDELGSELIPQPVNLLNSPIVANGGGVINSSSEFETFGGALDGIRTNNLLTEGKTYKLIIEGSTTSSGFTVGNTSGSGGQYGTGFGTFYFVASGSNATAAQRIWIRQVTAGVTTITNFSVKQVDPNDDWTKGTGWSIQDDQAQFSGSADAALEQAGVFTEGTKYKVSIDVAEISGGELEVKDQTTIHQAITSAGGYEFTFTAANTALQLNANTGSVERTIKINSITAQEVSSTTSLAINSIGEAIFATGDKFSLLNINNNTTYDLTINANQSASDTTLTITSFDFEAIVPVGSIVTFNKKNLIKQYQDDTLQEVTDNGNTTTNSIMIGSSSAPSEKLEVSGNIVSTQNIILGNNNDIKFKNSVGNSVGVMRFNSSNELIIFNGNSPNGDIFFKDGGPTGTTNLMIDGATGNVGIGLTNPSAKLQVSATGTTSQEIAHFGNSNDVAKIKLQLDGVGSSKQVMLDSSNNEDIVLNTQGDSYFINNLGIGLTNPSEKLEVNGDTLVSGDVMADTYKPAASSEPIKFKNSSSTELARITDGGTLLVNTTSPTHTNNPESLKVRHDDSDPANQSSAVFIDSNMSGSSATGGDVEHNGLNIDLDSSATGGDTSDEHRVRGIKLDVNITGDSDQVYGIHSDTGGNHSSGTIGALRGINNFVVVANSGNYGTIIGGYDFVRLNDSSTPNIATINATRGEIQLSGYSNTITNPYAAFFKIDNNSGGGTITNARGVYSEIEIDSGTISNARVFEAVVDINGGTLTSSYMYRGSISGSPSSDNFGLYLLGVSHNRVDGFLGIGKTPTKPLDIQTTENIVAIFKSTDSVSQLQISDDDTTFYFGVQNGVAFISDTSGSPASGLQVDGSGNVGIGTTPSTKLDVNGTCTSQLLQLRMQDEQPSEPETDKSIIFMDSNGDIKVLINVGGTTVTRTLATYA